MRSDLRTGRVQAWTAMVDAARSCEEDRRRLRWSSAAAGVCFVLLLAVGWSSTPPPTEVAAVLRPRSMPRMPRLPARWVDRREVASEARRVPLPERLIEPVLAPPEPLDRSFAEEIALGVEASPFASLGAIPEPPPMPEPELLRVTGDVRPPVKLSGAEPRYPEIARKAGIAGTVVVEAVIDVSGRVQSVEIVRGLPFGLGEAVVDAVRTWRFEPATLNGRPVAVRYHLTATFHLG